jgi:FKBP-type peptidyl-prolyl cis-trans isomerase
MQLSLQTLKEGYGPQPQIGNKVTVHYVAFL